MHFAIILHIAFQNMKPDDMNAILPPILLDI